MMKFVLDLILIEIIYFLAFVDSISIEEPDLNYCELSSDQKKKFEECFDSHLTEEDKEMKTNFAKCLKYETMAEYYDYICTLDSLEEENEVVENCEKEIGDDFVTNVPQEDKKLCYDDAKSA